MSTRIADLDPGGAPLLGEPLPVELANTRYAVRGTPHEGLAEPAHLAAWLRDMAPRLGNPPSEAALLAVDAHDLARALDLRDCVGALLTAAMTDTVPAADTVERLNTYTRAAPQWRELTWPTAVTRTEADPITAVLAELAGATVDLLTGPDRTELRACHGPGCILHFVRNNPRREWCSAGCGNRARVARHYRRSKNPPVDG
ncbi:CGNR zinc finger domain-containing protein [Embleya sp. NPDC055664]|uniref:CGNR zinc finger domain-containing protein n=1 Tax=Embleya sp. NPDC059237 TaxID=3346784 RepID=UPI0036A45422